MREDPPRRSGPDGGQVIALEDVLPDVRDGLTRPERVILWVLHQAQKDFGQRPVPTATLYGRVVEHIDLSVSEFQRLMQRLAGHGVAQRDPTSEFTRKG